jgi:hypothetical protein
MVSKMEYPVSVGIIGIKIAEGLKSGWVRVFG